MLNKSKNVALLRYIVSILLAILLVIIGGSYMISVIIGTSTFTVSQSMLDIGIDQCRINGGTNSIKLQPTSSKNDASVNLKIIAYCANNTVYSFSATTIEQNPVSIDITSGRTFIPTEFIPSILICDVNGGVKTLTLTYAFYYNKITSTCGNGITFKSFMESEETKSLNHRIVPYNLRLSDLGPDVGDGIK